MRDLDNLIDIHLDADIMAVLSRLSARRSGTYGELADLINYHGRGHFSYFTI